MRLITPFAILALLTSTLGFPAVQSCLMPSNGGHAAFVSCRDAGCCGFGKECTCMKTPPADSHQPATFTPATHADLSLPAATLAATTPVPPRPTSAGEALTADEVPSPLAGHVRCLGGRAPPLS